MKRPWKETLNRITRPDSGDGGIVKTSVILASWLLVATSAAWAQEEGAEGPSEAGDLPPPESLPSLEEMSRAESVDSSAEETASEGQDVDEKTKGEPAPAAEDPQPPSDTPAAPEETPPEPTAEEKTEETPPASDAATPEPYQTPEASSATSSNSSLHREAGRWGSDFGSFRVGFGAGQPTFDEKVVKYYDDLYGKPRLHPDMFLDYYFFDWYLTLGVGGRLRYYRTTGYAAQTSNPTGDSLSEAEIDRNSDVELVLIPAQAVLTAEITPWRTSFFTLNAWTGVERMYVQETRHPKDGASSFAATDSDDDSGATYVSRGWNTASVVGASVSLRLDYFDRASVNSLNIIGFRSVFLTPYMEIVKTQKATMGKWDRRILGLLFTFESIR